MVTIRTGDEDINELTRICGAFAEGEHRTIYVNEDFGHRRITVERPLKPNFQVNEERPERLQAEKAWEKLAELDREAVLTMLRGMAGGGAGAGTDEGTGAVAAWTERPAFEAALKSAAGPPASSSTRRRRRPS